MSLPMKAGIYGNELAIASAGSRQVVAVPASKAASPPIQLDQYCRNGKPPDAAFANALMEATNQGILYRSKEVFSALGRIQQGMTSGAATRNRWRFAFRTGPYTHALYAVVLMAPPASGYDQNSYGKLTIYSDTGEFTTVTSETFTYGVSPTGSSTATGFPYFKVVTKLIDGLSPDTTYYAKFSDENYGRILSACVCDMQSATENFSGYLPQNLTQQSGILDVYREKAATAARNLWRRGGSKLFNFAVYDGTTPLSISVATPTNLLDQTSTTVSAATPGYTLNMTGKARLSQTSGVPVTLSVFAKSSSAGGEGRVYLKNSAGTAVLTLTDAFFTVGAWSTVTGYLPATTDKYDLQFDNHGVGTLSVYAVSAWEQD